MDTKEINVLLIIVDISGYTRFMVSNKTALVHSQVIITELIKTIMRQVEIPLEICELEGDAVFLYAVKEDSETLWEDAKKKIGSKLIKFFEAFSAKLVELSESNTCNCTSCKNINILTLKIIVHSGKVVLHQIGKFNQLSGVDVIIAHKLLKNSVKSSKYILMTHEAYNKVEFPEKIEITQGEERYDDLGSIKTYVYFPDVEKFIVEIKEKHNYSSILNKTKSALLKMFISMLIRLKLVDISSMQKRG